MVFFASFVAAAALPSDSTVIMTSRNAALACLGPPHCIKHFHVCLKADTCLRHDGIQKDQALAICTRSQRLDILGGSLVDAFVCAYQRRQSQHEEFELRELMHGRIKMVTGMSSAWARSCQSMYCWRQHHVTCQLPPASTVMVGAFSRMMGPGSPPKASPLDGVTQWLPPTRIFLVFFGPVSCDEYPLLKELPLLSTQPKPTVLLSLLKVYF